MTAQVLDLELDPALGIDLSQYVPGDDVLYRGPVASGHSFFAPLETASGDVYSKNLPDGLDASNCRIKVEVSGGACGGGGAISFAPNSNTVKYLRGEAVPPEWNLMFDPQVESGTVAKLPDRIATFRTFWIFSTNAQSRTGNTFASSHGSAAHWQRCNGATTTFGAETVTISFVALPPPSGETLLFQGLAGSWQGFAEYVDDEGVEGAPGLPAGVVASSVRIKVAVSGGACGGESSFSFTPSEEIVKYLQGHDPSHVWMKFPAGSAKVESGTIANLPDRMYGKPDFFVFTSPPVWDNAYWSSRDCSFCQTNRCNGAARTGGETVKMTYLLDDPVTV